MTSVAEAVHVGSCWSVGFTFDLCCAPEHGPEGNPTCWDEVYTHQSCCSDGGDPSAAGCDSPYFSRFRQLVSDYYDSGRMRPDLIDAWPRVLASSEARWHLCAAAVLQARLLQMEERAYLEPAGQALDRLAVHALLLQRGIQEGRLSSADVQAWPLERGLQRLRDASGRAAGRSRRRAGVTLVLCYCNEGLEWMNSTIGRPLMRQVDLAIVQKCPEAAGGIVVPFRHVWKSVRVDHVEDLPLRADECSGYLGYLREHYHNLPGHMVFIHPDAPEHTGLGMPNILDDTLGALARGASIPFAHLGNNRVTMKWDPFTMAPLWRGLFGSSVVPGPGAVRTYCCSHFVVSRERVRLRPRRFYEEAFRFVTSPSSYSYLPVAGQEVSGRDIVCRLPCQNMMWVWHVIFGEDLDLPHRMYDERLPLFLQLRNIRTAYMDAGGSQGQKSS